MPSGRTIARAAFWLLTLGSLAWLYLAPGDVVAARLGLLKWVAAGAFLAFELVVAAWMFRLLFRETAEQSEQRIARELRRVPTATLRALMMVEMRVWLYGLKRAGHDGWQGQTFSYARQGDNAKMQKLFLWLMLAELVIAHVFLGFIVGPFWRWAIFAITLYALFWMFAEWRATHLRPVSIDGDALHVRYGVLHSLVIPLDQIDGVAEASVRDAHEYPIRMAGFGAPNVGLALRSPVRSVLGREATKLALALDEPRAFIDALRARLPQAAR